MNILKLIIIFAVILLVMRLKQPTHISVAFGALATIILFKLGLGDLLEAIKIGAFGDSTIKLILAFYSITFLQRMLEKRDHLILAERSLLNIFNSRRINAMVAPFIIGLLPSAGAVLIAAPIVDNAGESYLDIKERTFVTSFYRHISEAFLPTYASILLALNLSGVDMTAFVLAMIPMALALFYIGYIFYIRKIPKAKADNRQVNKKEEVRNLIRSLWTIALTILIILVFDIPVHYATLLVIVLSLVVNKFSWKEIKPMFISALEVRLILTTVTIMVFKELLVITGVIEELPYFFRQLPIQPAIVYGLIFFFGTLLAGSQAMIVLALPLAFATIEGGGLALLVFLMNITYIAMQISPTHICLAIITEHNEVSFTDLVKKTIPVLLVFTLVASIYSYILYLVF